MSNTHTSKFGKKKTLLFVVEDNHAYRILLSRILERKGFEVMTFEGPEEAIKKLRFKTPEVFISDIEMPVMNGFDLFEEVYNKFPLLKIPFLYISSTNSPERIARAGELGAMEMLNKPVSADLLFRSLDRVLKSPAA